MKVHTLFIKYIPKAALFFFVCIEVKAQPITGVWKGKLGNSRVELKLIRKGDSLIGTSYYYDSKTSYRRYSVKGYFDDKDNDVIWWDDVLIEESGAHHNAGTGLQPLLAVADFNCPGEGVMKLDGKSSLKDDVLKEKKELHLVKGSSASLFPDEWDFLIDNYVYGVNHPEIIDSIEQIAINPEPESSGVDLTKQTTPEPIVNSGTAFIPRPLTNTPAMEKTVAINSPTTNIAVIEKPVPEKKDLIPPAFVPPSQQTNEERFTNTKKILQNVIPLKGDSIELRFYDNAEIDGDSIAVFLNGHLLKEHILLAEQAYIMKLAVSDLQPDNELVMVAENLGTIPPNTSLMVAVVGDKKYEAHLESTMGTSALVRLIKP